MTNVLIQPNCCDSLVKLRGNDLLELLATIESLMIEYRDLIHIPSNVTFGVEIEYEKLDRSQVTTFINQNLSGWESKSDGTVSSGGEINSPIMSDTKKYWDELRTICVYLKKHRAVTNRHAGGHIHVGVQALGRSVDAWRVFVKLYMLYEDVMIRFFYGDKLNRRETFNQYSPPIGNRIYGSLKKINMAKRPLHILSEMPSNRYSALNFCRALNADDFEKASNGRTLELRCPNGTDEEVIWQNNINTFTKMLDSSKKQAIDEDYLDFKIKSYDESKEDFYYDEIQLKKALEFVDLVFDNNLDKANFLRQYFKSFQNSPESSEAVYASSFIK